MTYRSASRGIMYTSPPTESDDDRREETQTDEEATRPDDRTENAREMPDLGSTSATTDANWTGTVPADD